MCALCSRTVHALQNSFKLSHNYSILCFRDIARTRIALPREIAALEAPALGRLLKTNVHGGHLRPGQPSAVRIVAMRQSDETLAQERFAAAVALLQKTGGRDDRRLHLAVAHALALVHLHLAVARALQPPQFVVLLWCRREEKRVDM